MFTSLSRTIGRFCSKHAPWGRRQSAAKIYRPAIEELEERLVPADYLWVGRPDQQDGNLWSVPGNWRDPITGQPPAQMPGPNDTVIFGPTGNNASVVDVAFGGVPALEGRVRELRAAGNYDAGIKFEKTLRVDVAVVQQASDTGGTGAVIGATTGSGNLIISGGGSYQCSGGRIVGPAGGATELILEANGSMEITGAVTISGRSITNSGRITWRGGEVNVESGVIVDNVQGSAFEAAITGVQVAINFTGQDSCWFKVEPGGSFYQNGQRIRMQINFVGQGYLELTARADTMWLLRQITLGGHIVVNSAGRLAGLQLAPTANSFWHNINDGTVFSGDGGGLWGLIDIGPNRMDLDPGTVTVEASAALGVDAGGTLGGAGTLQVLAGSGLLVEGQHVDSGTTNILPGGQIVLPDGGKAVNRTINNFGSGSQIGNFYFNGGRFNNLLGGNLFLRDGGLRISIGGQVTPLLNEGAMIKDLGNGACTIELDVTQRGLVREIRGAINFTRRLPNQGMIDIQNGIVQAADGLTQDAAGSIMIANGSTDGARLEVTGDFNMTGGTVNDGDTVTISDNFSQTGGTTSVVGTATSGASVTVGLDYSISAVRLELNEHAAVSVGRAWTQSGGTVTDGGTITVTGAVLESAGTLTVGGTFSTGGTWTHTGAQASVGGSVSIGGSLLFNGGSLDDGGSVTVVADFDQTGGTVTDNGTMLVNGLATHSAGELWVLAGRQLTVQGSYTQSGGDTYVYGPGQMHVGGVFTIYGGALWPRLGAFLVADSGLFIESGGTLSGNATISGNLTNRGYMEINDPDTSPIHGSTITLNGSFAQESLATLVMAVAESGDYSQMFVSALATFRGTVDVSYGVPPQLGQIVPLINYGVRLYVFESHLLPAGSAAWYDDPLPNWFGIRGVGGLIMPAAAGFSGRVNLPNRRSRRSHRLRPGTDNRRSDRALAVGLGRCGRGAAAASRRADYEFAGRAPWADLGQHDLDRHECGRARVVHRPNAGRRFGIRLGSGQLGATGACAERRGRRSRSADGCRPRDGARARPGPQPRRRDAGESRCGRAAPAWLRLPSLARPSSPKGRCRSTSCKRWRARRATNRPCRAAWPLRAPHKAPCFTCWGRPTLSPCLSRGGMCPWAGPRPLTASPASSSAAKATASSSAESVLTCL